MEEKRFRTRNIKNGYYCEKCSYLTKNKFDFAKHMETTKCTECVMRENVWDDFEKGSYMERKVISLENECRRLRWKLRQTTE